MSEYVVWSMEHQGWWPRSRRGYVETLDQAGRFSETEAAEIVAHANIVKCHEAMIPIEALSAIPDVRAMLLGWLALSESQQQLILHSFRFVRKGRC